MRSFQRILILTFFLAGLAGCAHQEQPGAATPTESQAAGANGQVITVQSPTAGSGQNPSVQGQGGQSAAKTISPLVP